MVTIRDILTEALTRSNLITRKRQAPADMMENAFRLFKGIISKYTFDNFINYSRSEIEVIPYDNKVTITDVASIATVLVYDNGWHEMRFVSYSQFYQDQGDYVYTWKYNDRDIELYFKDKAKNHRVKIITNIELDYNINDQLPVPSMYVELFTTALTYKLAVNYPRLDATQVNVLKNELEEIEKTVKANISSNKILTRGYATSDTDSFMDGSFMGL